MVKDIILADSDGRELGAILDSNITVDTNGEYEFSVQIARSNWYPELTFSSYVYITETEYGGITFCRKLCYLLQCYNEWNTDIWSIKFRHTGK